MTDTRRPAVLLTMLLGFVLVPSNGVSALDLTGAWAVSADQCSKVFTRRGRANVRRRPPEYCSVEYAPMLKGLRKAGWKE